MKKRFVIVWLVALIMIAGLACSSSEKSLYGTWTLVPEKSTDLAPWKYRHLQVEIRKEGEAITLLQKWLQRKKVAFVDSVTFVPGGQAVQVPVETYVWPENWFMGVLAKKSSSKKISGVWKKQDQTLVVTREQAVLISQGQTTITTTREYGLDWRGKTLTIKEKRSTRPTLVKYVLKRIG